MRLLGLLVAGIIGLTAFAGRSDAGVKELDSAKFLQVVRRPPGRECWAKMNGTAWHRRRGQKMSEASLFLGILFTPQRTLAQIVIGGKQGYYVGQKYAPGCELTSIIPLRKGGYKQSLLADFGLRPEDLTMTFIFWDFVRELPRESIKGQECRVFLLRSPEKAKQELVRVFISARYFFPLKVEWVKGEASKAYRYLEVTSFRKENDFWLVSSMNLYGPGWRTRIKFSDTDAGFKDKLPKDLFKKID